MKGYQKRMSSSAAQGAVEAALADGYHLIDTAEAYYNEDGLVVVLKILVSIVKTYLSVRSSGLHHTMIQMRLIRRWIV